MPAESARSGPGPTRSGLGPVPLRRRVLVRRRLPGGAALEQPRSRGAPASNGTRKPDGTSLPARLCRIAAAAAAEPPPVGRLSAGRDPSRPRAVTRRASSRPVEMAAGGRRPACHRGPGPQVPRAGEDAAHRPRLEASSTTCPPPSPPPPPATNIAWALAPRQHSEARPGPTGVRPSPAARGSRVRRRAASRA